MLLLLPGNESRSFSHTFFLRENQFWKGCIFNNEILGHTLKTCLMTTANFEVLVMIPDVSNYYIWGGCCFWVLLFFWFFFFLVYLFFFLSKWVYLGFISHQHCGGYMPTFQLFWWRKTSFVSHCIITDMNGHLSRTTDVP
jgi:hypothetical protein